jgi:hypothetical protein
VCKLIVSLNVFFFFLLRVPWDDEEISGRVESESIVILIVFIVRPKLTLVHNLVVLNT